MRYLYTFLLYLALPYIFLRLWRRSWRQPDYRKRWSERLGTYPFQFEKCIWVHAVSVGETLAAIPLIKALQVSYPSLPLLVTTMTLTGAQRVKEALGDSVTHAYLPYDLPGAMQQFLNTMHPVIGIVMETELWPNLLFICRQKKIPICLVNARLSTKSAKGYQRIAPLTRAMLSCIDMIAAHGEKDAKRFIALGASQNQVIVTGNIKFDLALPADWTKKSTVLRESLGKERFVWIAASTHEGEEEMVLKAHQRLRETNPQALLILVPRHPERFNAVAAQCSRLFITERRSSGQPVLPETAVYLGDTMGELLVMYGAAEVAFVGGSLIPRGGHNMLEPAALAKPILTGPHLFNFAEISELFITQQAMLKVMDAASLSEQLLFLMRDQDLCTRLGTNAARIVADNRGALAKQLAVIDSLLKTSITVPV